MEQGMLNNGQRQQLEGIAALGRNEDTYLAHVAPDEMIVPAQALRDNPLLKQAIEKSISKYGIDPNQFVVGNGSMDLNPLTGLPEFGFLSKVWKKVKKVVKKVAPVAMFIPGVGQALGAVGGSLLGKVGLGNVASGIGGLVGKIPGLGGVGNAITAGSGGTLGQAFTFGKDAITSGIGGLFKGGIGNAGQSGIGRIEDIAKFMTGDTGQTRTEELIAAGYTQEQIKNAKANGTFNQLVANARASGKVSGRGLIGGAQNLLTGGSQGQGGGGGMFGGNLGLMGLAGLAAKIAYDSAKERSGGLAETPKVTMDQLGRYEMAKNLGTGGSRADFGLAPAPVALEFNMGGPVYGYEYGGPVRQYFNKGGLAMVEELDMREGGESDGPGTGTSDDIPAMLSDGEFVMTAKATRGAGAFDVNKTKSGIELIKGGSASREKGVKNMRELMNIFEAI
jgi:hypothetical protein